MPVYKLRYFFDYGSGRCLWAANEEARERFDYAVGFDALNLPFEVQSVGVRLLQRYDSSLDWDNPAGPSLWSDHDWANFYRDAEQFLEQVRACLGTDFEIKAK